MELILEYGKSEFALHNIKQLAIRIMTITITITITIAIQGLITKYYNYNMATNYYYNYKMVTNYCYNYNTVTT